VPALAYRWFNSLTSLPQRGLELYRRKVFPSAKAMLTALGKLQSDGRPHSETRRCANMAASSKIKYMARSWIVTARRVCIEAGMA